ncbi:MAG: hypothetical protein HQ592_02190 [Planctomycetes bacterium]|nr:hypothetical protein [Planctomycetota bacterium]
MQVKEAKRGLAVRLMAAFSRRSARRRLIVFTRQPRPGKVKTRMIPLLGAAGAARLHRLMTEHTMTWARELAARSATSVEVYFESENEDAASARRSIRRWLGRDHRLQAGRAGQTDRPVARPCRRMIRRPPNNKAGPPV